MSKIKLVRMLYTLVGFDDKGTEIERIEGLTQEEAFKQSKRFTLFRVLESGIVSPKVICEVDKCDRIAVAVIVLHSRGKPIKVCKYHAAGVYVKFRPPEPVKNKAYYNGFVIAPDWLCVTYCPSYWVDGCRAYQEVRSRAEKKKREKGYEVCGKIYTVLCHEDEWWRK